jgi:malate dehydrogenase (oxaloacetate-decarboxylating)(NADP+)
MSAEQLAVRMLSSEALVNSYSLRSGQIQTDEWKRLAYAVSELSNTEILIDIARLANHTVQFFNHKPVTAMLSYSNFGSDSVGSPAKVHEAIDIMQNEYADLAIDGEMQVKFAMNKDARDEKYPFTRLKGKDVNTLIFPNLSSANATYQLIQSMDEAEVIGPIQMGLNKPIHFTDCEASVRDIVNITAVAVIDAIVEKKKKQ